MILGEAGEEGPGLELLEVPASRARDQESPKALRQREYPLPLGLDALKAVGEDGLVPGARPQELGEAHDRGDGRAQLVREVVDEGLPVRLLGLEPLYLVAYGLRHAPEALVEPSGDLAADDVGGREEEGGGGEARAGEEGDVEALEVIEGIDDRGGAGDDIDPGDRRSLGVVERRPELRAPDEVRGALGGRLELGTILEPGLGVQRSQDEDALTAGQPDLELGILAQDLGPARGEEAAQGRDCLEPVEGVAGKGLGYVAHRALRALQGRDLRAHLALEAVEGRADDGRPPRVEAGDARRGDRKYRRRH